MTVSLKDKLSSGPCFGTFLKIPRPEVVDVLALADFDFVICDMEHAQMDEGEARVVIQRAMLADLPVIVRLPEPVPGLVNRLLEAGAVGIQMPRLRTARETDQLYKMMHYPPHGTRSVGNANLQAGYGTVPIAEYLERENARVITVGQFETKEIDEPREPMFQGLDVAFIGPTDLSVDFGAPGNADHEDVQRRIREVEQVANSTGTIMGAFVPTLQAAQRSITAGYRFIAVSGDVSLLTNGAKSLVNSLRESSHQVTEMSS